MLLPRIELIWYVRTHEIVFENYILLSLWSTNKIITWLLVSQFMKTLQQELNALESKKDDFIDEFSEVGFFVCFEHTVITFVPVYGLF